MTAPKSPLVPPMTFRQYVASEALKAIIARGSSTSQAGKWAVEATDGLLDELKKRHDPQ